jgi:dephospho-CoA kinase
MIRLALTGSIAMGKSTVARMFEAAGIPLFDADGVVHRLQSDDADVIAAIGARFPGTVAGRVLHREALRAAVLGDPVGLKALEAIVHPAVEAAQTAFIATHRDAPALLFDIPLLFETGGADAFDKVIVVTAPADVQRARALDRPGMSGPKLDAILDRQMPDAEKRRRADFVIDNGGELSATQRQVDEIIACLGLAAGR